MRVKFFLIRKEHNLGEKHRETIRRVFSQSEREKSLHGALNPANIGNFYPVDYNFRSEVKSIVREINLTCYYLLTVLGWLLH